jgi:hypothetical protein
VGAALIGLGAVGIVIPGPIPPGASFVVLGVLFCWPRLLLKLGDVLARRFPRLYRCFVAFISDLSTNLKRRYPRLAH